MLPQGEANEQLVWIQQDSQVLTVLNHTSDERGDVSVSDAYWNITNVPMGGALADAGVDAAVYGEALAAVDRRVRRFWNSAVLECCLVLLIFFATVLPLDLLGLGEQVLRVQNVVVASLVALWLGVTLASMAWNRCVDARISSVLRRAVGDKMPGVRVEYVARGRYCLATGTRLLRFTVEAGAPAASVAAADQMERGGAGVDPPGLKPLETTSTPVV